MAQGLAVRFENSYARLPDRFHARLDPTPVSQPALIRWNEALATDLGIDRGTAGDADLAALFSGNRRPEGAEPLAMAYAGHQFGNFVPQLGDGRALLLGEVVDGQGRRRDIQLKGSGPTPFSRRGDGRAALGPVLREYIVSEAMNALGIPTTRSLAAVTTGERVFREDILPGGVLTRVAASHIRVGTFQFFAPQGDEEGVKTLADYAIDRHDPRARDADNAYLAFLNGVIDRQAALVARWMQVGFIHGVMNTDNMTISGETIDYGPCAFLDVYHPGKVFSSIDHGGRYAFSNQAGIAQWNLARLAETLLPLIDSDRQRAIDIATEAVMNFTGRFEAYWTDGMRRKIGLAETAKDADAELAADFLAAMARGHADFTLAFRHLSDAVEDGADETALRAQFDRAEDLDEWLPRWRTRLAAEPMDAAARKALMDSANPLFIPRNHRIEEAITAAVTAGDFGPFHRLVEILAHPFVPQPDHADYATPPRPDERVVATFCGT
ncbi:MAG: YdiU family protein [Alphaproteobacteria bacterium]